MKKLPSSPTLRIKESSKLAVTLLTALECNTPRHKGLYFAEEEEERTATVLSLVPHNMNVPDFDILIDCVIFNNQNKISKKRKVQKKERKT